MKPNDVICFYCFLPINFNNNFYRFNFRTRTKDRDSKYLHDNCMCWYAGKYWTDIRLYTGQLNRLEFNCIVCQKYINSIKDELLQYTTIVTSAQGMYKAHITFCLPCFENTAGKQFWK